MGQERELPECEELFSKYFDRWYDDGDRRRKIYKGTRPDLERVYRPGIPSSELTPLRGETLQTVSGMLEGMLGSIRGDFPTYLKVEGEISLNWIGAFDAHFDRGRIRELLDSSD